METETKIGRRTEIWMNNKNNNNSDDFRILGQKCQRAEQHFPAQILWQDVSKDNNFTYYRTQLQQLPSLPLDLRAFLTDLFKKEGTWMIISLATTTTTTAVTTKCLSVRPSEWMFALIILSVLRQQVVRRNTIAAS